MTAEKARDVFLAFSYHGKEMAMKAKRIASIDQKLTAKTYTV